MTNIFQKGAFYITKIVEKFVFVIKGNYIMSKKNQKSVPIGTDFFRFTSLQRRHCYIFRSDNEAKLLYL